MELRSLRIVLVKPLSIAKELINNHRILFPSKSWWDLSRYNRNGWQMLAIHFSLHCTALGIDYTHAEFIGFRFQTWHTHSFSGAYLFSLSITGENGGHYSNITNVFETWSYIHVPMIFDNKGSCLKRCSLQDATATSHLTAPSGIWMTEWYLCPPIFKETWFIECAYVTNRNVCSVVGSSCHHYLDYIIFTS